MNTICISAILRKDTVAAIRNSLLLMALVSGVIFSLVYYVLPTDVEETFYLAAYGDSELFSGFAEAEEGIAIDMFPSEEAVEHAVSKGDYIAGVVLPDDFGSIVMTGQKPEITLYFNSEQPESVKTSIEYFVELAVEYAVLGVEAPVMEAEILGEDMAGEHIPLRERSIPLYVVLALVMEMWTIATLIVEESAAGTMRAVLVTPATPSDVIAAKGALGISYSVGVAAVILVLTRSLRGDLPVLFLGILLGAVMAVSLGLFLGSLTTSITGSYAYASVPLLVFMLPALMIFVPDISLSIIKVIPTYYLVGAINQVLNHGAGLTEVWKDYLIIIFCDILFFGLGVFALRRRYS
ncbi:MAG: ABC transporter permease [Candidatus Methanofastidiosia archaeon]|jgi:ABC-2 type transport system permease protein